MPWGYKHVYHHYVQTSSLKLLGQSKPNIMWTLLGTRGHKWSWSHDQDGCHAHIYGQMAKSFKTLLYQNQKSHDLDTWHGLSGTQCL